MANKDYSQYIVKKSVLEDKRSFLVRLVSSIKIKFSFVKDRKTKKTGACVEVSGGADF